MRRTTFALRRVYAHGQERTHLSSRELFPSDLWCIHANRMKMGLKVARTAGQKRCLTDWPNAH